MISNPLFLDTTLARGDVELLFLPLLYRLYHTDHRTIRSPRQLYVLVIILLILTQDAAFNIGR